MTTITAPTGRYLGAPKLRLFAGGEAARTARLAKPKFKRKPTGARLASQHDAPSTWAPSANVPASPAGDAPVLVAGKDATRRDAMIDELARTMAPDTRFAHAAASWEVLALAGSSRMVVLSGELEEITSESLMRMLSNRFPALPVVALDAPAELARA
ncbi:MAG TPA: hypothetical protein VH081_03095 [Solirubrobacteraceae bacterium]|nr:hypothetical protein [Solirubrobacteraceae bacterium]